MEAIAKLRGIKGSPQKARLVIDLIRGRNVSQALAILKFTNKRAAQPIAKCLNSAIANATYLAEQQNIAIDPDDLWVKACFVDMGPHKNRRRMRPAPQGRAYREQRHYCHITIEVSSEGQPEKVEKAPKKAEQPKGKAAEDKNVKVGVKAEQKKKAKALKETKAEETETTEETKAAETPETVEAQEQTAENVQAEEVKAKDESIGETEEVSTEETAPEGSAKIAAQTEEEKTGSDEAEERQLDENEQLERQ